MPALRRGKAVANGGCERRRDHHGREAEAIVAVLRREGPLDARTLRARVEARLSGPGRFGPALRRAMRDGRVRRVGRRTWAAIE